mmetsp:Transcript_10566/g.27720  ORF Transcript_10566/g.27720 Transcript_10566/m.27720 type:complete len:88 (+) Transcript_10566:1364-1627(+)
MRHPIRNQGGLGSVGLPIQLRHLRRSQGELDSVELQIQVRHPSRSRGRLDSVLTLHRLRLTRSQGGLGLAGTPEATTLNQPGIPNAK